MKTRHNTRSRVTKRVAESDDEEDQQLLDIMETSYKRAKRHEAIQDYFDEEAMEDLPGEEKEESCKDMDGILEETAGPVRNNKDHAKAFASEVKSVQVGISPTVEPTSEGPKITVEDGEEEPGSPEAKDKEDQKLSPVELQPGEWMVPLQDAVCLTKPPMLNIKNPYSSTLKEGKEVSFVEDKKLPAKLPNRVTGVLSPEKLSAIGMNDVAELEEHALANQMSTAEAYMQLVAAPTITGAMEKASKSNPGKKPDTQMKTVSPTPTRPKKKWSRLAKPSNADLTGSPFKKAATPNEVVATGSKDGCMLLYTQKLDVNTGVTREHYCAPMVLELNRSSDLRDELECYNIFSLRGKDGKSLKRDPTSEYNWNVFVKLPDNGKTVWTNAELKAFQEAFVGIYNRLSKNEEIFRYPTKVVPGSILDRNAADVPHLDSLLTDSDVMKVIGHAYGVQNPADFEDLAAEEEIVGLYFKSCTRGKEAMMSYAKKHGFPKRD